MRGELCKELSGKQSRQVFMQVSNVGQIIFRNYKSLKIRNDIVQVAANIVTCQTRLAAKYSPITLLKKKHTNGYLYIIIEHDFHPSRRKLRIRRSRAPIARAGKRK